MVFSTVCASINTCFVPLFRVDHETLDTAAALLEQRAFKTLVDFDNHLDDVSQDWKNKDLNKLIDDVAAPS